jgi:hypothetical protein
MINHGRNLLLNTAASNNLISSDTWAEYVPADYTAIKNLPQGLRLIRHTLLGRTPDARFLNLRVRELMSYIHQTDLAAYLYQLDPRVTYWPTASDEFLVGAQAATTVTQIVGAPRELQLRGEFFASQGSGRALQQYLATAGITVGGTENPEANTVFIAQKLGVVTSAPVVFPVGTSARSTVAELPDTGVKVLLDFADAATPFAQLATEVDDLLLAEDFIGAKPLISEQPSTAMASTAGELAETLAQWIITVRATPAPVATTLIPVLELLGEPVFLELFGVAEQEPYTTFKNIWFDHYAPAYRLAALTLAVIYRMEELRK